MGGILIDSGTVTLINSIVAGNSIGDCSGTIIDGGHNIDGDGSCGLTHPSSQSSTDPQLGALADNGGPTETHLPQRTSPAIDAGDDIACPATDQRGEPRPVDGNKVPDGVANCDIGAVEVPEPDQLFLLGAGLAFLWLAKSHRLL